MGTGQLFIPCGYKQIEITDSKNFFSSVDVCVINPPRSGISKKVIRAILRLGPQRIVYSSCNPQTMFTDIAQLTEQYTPEFVEPFDFFPHTPHMECLTVLKLN